MDAYMKRKQTRTYFGHLTFWYEPFGFVFPIAGIFDRDGVSICFGYWSIDWTWKRKKE